jgi:hypothetical protein
VLPLVGASQAFGDYAPQTGDVVGVGGDTPQYALDFLINGDASGHLGFDASTGVNRVIPFDATADGNGRQAYTQGSTELSPIPLNPTVVLRAGDNPVQRPQSSSAAINALVADNNTPETINYVDSASAPSLSSEPGIASVPGGLDYIKFGTDSIQVVADQTATNAPSALSATVLANIYDGTYKTWGAIPGYSGPAPGDTIIAEIPPSSSSVYSNFVKALTAAVPSFTVDSAFVQTVEQNSPNDITGASTPADAIAPFSAARLALWNDGYFYNPATVFPGASSPLTPGVVALTGTGSLNYPITDYIVWRANDTSSTTPYQPGGALNWVQTLFYDPTGPAPYIDTPEGQTLITSSGVTPSYGTLQTIT